jgi:hypothetical protein
MGHPNVIDGKKPSINVPLAPSQPARRLSVVAVGVWLFAGAACGAAPEAEPLVAGRAALVAAPAPTPVGARAVIANIDAAGQVGALNVGELRRRFADGGRISGFRVVRLDNGYNLLRIGRTSDGACHTQALPLMMAGSVLRVGDLRWVVDCFSPACGDLDAQEIQDIWGDDHGDYSDSDTISAGFCNPNSARTGCSCSPGGADCTFGMTSVSYPTVLLHDF